MNSLKKPHVWLRSRLRSFFWQLSGSAHLPIYFHASPTRMAAGRVKPGLMNASGSFFLRKPSHKIMRSFCIPIKCNVFHFLCCTSFRVLGTQGGLTAFLRHCVVRLPHCCLKKWCVPSCGQSQSWTPSQPLDVGQDNPRAGVPSATQVPDIETALKAVQKIRPKLEARMIEFLAEWLVTFLIPATHDWK